MTPKTIMYEIKQMSPEPSRPKRMKKTPVTTKPYLNKPINSDDYLLGIFSKTEQYFLLLDKLLPDSVMASSRSEVRPGGSHDRIWQKLV